ncbi:hypothetical protein SLEP1_g40438 [Rubroshorea leprosula]|uniref:Uncharacterized protein n=1 Tax=Rubroshorea leprosula TaxID=152421 RepID=A0AAV5L3Q4_9ROSI|nr:hypothetical protein SLEP1_g40438 [Rubroshorea leprosula]
MEYLLEHGTNLATASVLGATTLFDLLGYRLMLLKKLVLFVLKPQLLEKLHVIFLAHTNFTKM